MIYIRVSQEAIDIEEIFLYSSNSGVDLPNFSDRPKMTMGFDQFRRLKKVAVYNARYRRGSGE
jgi:hypothetical protein